MNSALRGYQTKAEELSAIVRAGQDHSLMQAASRTEAVMRGVSLGLIAQDTGTLEIFLDLSAVSAVQTAVTFLINLRRGDYLFH